MGRILSIVAALVLVASLTGSGSAQVALRYTLNWWTVDGGGVTHDPHGPYELSVTIGQPDAARVIGGGYRLNGGFWPHGAYLMRHLPLVVKRYRPS